MSEAEWFGPAYGRRLDSDRDEDVLATLDTQWAATDWVVENARRYFTEASLSDFQALGTLGRRWLHIETQREYLLDESQVLNEPDPTTTGVECFAVDGYRIMFFRARDFDRVTSRVVHGEVVAREVPNDFQPPPRGLRNVIALRLHGDDEQRARDDAQHGERIRDLDRRLAALGVRSPKRRTAEPATLSTSLDRRNETAAPSVSTIKRTAAPRAKTPPPIYGDPMFAERQREAWEQRHAIVRHFHDAEIRVRP